MEGQWDGSMGSMFIFADLIFAINYKGKLSRAYKPLLTRNI